MKYNINLKSITPLIFSNRMNDALYKGVDFSKIDFSKKKIVTPVLYINFLVMKIER